MSSWQQLARGSSPLPSPYRMPLSLLPTTRYGFLSDPRGSPPPSRYPPNPRTHLARGSHTRTEPSCPPDTKQPAQPEASSAANHASAVTWPACAPFMRHDAAPPSPPPPPPAVSHSSTLPLRSPGGGGGRWGPRWCWQWAALRSHPQPPSPHAPPPPIPTNKHCRVDVPNAFKSRLALRGCLRPWEQPQSGWPPPSPPPHNAFAARPPALPPTRAPDMIRPSPATHISKTGASWP